MKLQFRDSALRVRIDETELSGLLDGKPLALTVILGERVLLDVRLGLAAQLAFHGGTPWYVSLPERDVRTYADALPRRDALVFMLEEQGSTPLRLEFEVDVRDSVARRGIRPPRAIPPD